MRLTEAPPDITNPVGRSVWVSLGGPPSEVGVVFFGQGIDIQSLPERIPDSMYARRLGLYNPNLAVSVQGKHNRGGVLVELASEEEVGRAMTKVSGGKVIPGVGSMGRMPHISFCRLQEPPMVAHMTRALDMDGNVLKTGHAFLIRAKSEAEVQESARNLEKMLEEAGLFGPLTPRDRMPEVYFRHNLSSIDPDKEIDYFANDPEVWPDETTVYCVHERKSGVEIRDSKRFILNNGRPAIKGICASCGRPIFRMDPSYHPYYQHPIIISAPQLTSQLSQGQGKPCYNCLRVLFTYDGFRWSPAPWSAKFGENTLQFATIDAPPQKVMVCPECGKCVICGLRGSKGVSLRSQTLSFKHHIPTLVFYCKEHDEMRMKSSGLPYNKVPKHLIESWSKYLAYQRDVVSSVDTPRSRERLEAVKGLMALFTDFT